MILTIILCVVILTCLFVIWNLLRKIEGVEDAYKDVTTTNIILYESLESTYSKMKEIDDRGIFASDDETGAVFTQLRDTLEVASVALQGDMNE
jgi:hypothetical protein